ncbi:D-aminoacyl-tRNA deacylase [Flavobacteriaceae bacterium]|jgi:D-tyrosyl-tRNA(Tyr) deacylase|nr:D-aminoacyl-tRNA deacylase [Flavobacteriaceae bacterium]MDA9893015.1 D-aminoacyl-tRNA deacylase [Flavobacteriaceae bacterium]MDC1056249.1 D-aminoacyl-tRNA deacylase [Flavobacteriaceae bacterium]MDC3368813.1 D-aminoacyl-tRNA deacylase [Flavobacteriaceae bacterium]
MRVVIQRVLRAHVLINQTEKREIGEGLVVLLGIETADEPTDVLWLVNKVVNMRIFNDAHGVMNQSLLEREGSLLVVSQFTLMAATKKGNRPSYIRAAKHEHAIPLYEFFLKTAQEKLGKKIVSGTFGADMEVALVNDGPVTIQIDSKNKE